MVKALRKRPRPDQLLTQQRKATNSSGRTVYLVLLALFGVTIANYLFGDFVFLAADGLILRDKTTIAATYIARVEEVHVKRGEHIGAGKPVLRLQSTQMLERLADLSSRRARLAAKAAEFKIRSETVTKLLPLAEKRETESAKVVVKVDRMSKLRLVTSARYDAVLRSQYEARQALVRLQAEVRVLADELHALNAARADADKALDDLRAHYGAGIVRAPAGGAAGATVPAIGDVFRPGETIMSIYSGAPFVLAYLPRRYLFPIRPGRRVKVTSGRWSVIGHVGEILPITAALPKEFQNTFKPRDRGQLARIVLSGISPFPLHEKVWITASYDWSKHLATLWKHVARFASTEGAVDSAEVMS